MRYLKKKNQTPQEKNHENLNRSNVYGFWANNLVLFSSTGLYLKLSYFYGSDHLAIEHGWDDVERFQNILVNDSCH